LANRAGVICIIIVLAAGGCASARQGIGDKLTLDKINRLTIGRTTVSEVRTMFGRPDFVKNLESGEVEYTYLQGRSDSSVWQILPIYRVYGSVEGLAGSVILLLRFRENALDFFIATDGRLTIKRESEHNSKTGTEKKEEGK
jgi:hypothetical protein